MKALNDDKIDQAAKLIAEHVYEIMAELELINDADDSNINDSEAFMDIFMQLEFAIEDKVIAHGKAMQK